MTMKTACLLCSMALLLALGSGCQHTKTGFSYDARFSDLTSNLTTVTVTNQLDPRLLRPSTTPFTLGPGDRVDIEVLGHPEARASTFVGPDGKLYFHLLPGLDVWGLTLSQTAG